jgi:hypothetical protein
MQQIMRNKINLAGILCVASLAFSMSLTAQTVPRTAGSPSASPKTVASPAGSAAKQSTRPVPFHGMISAVDQNAKTFTIAGKKQSRVFKVTDKTTVTKDGKTASMQDITENEEASGSYWKNADGTLEAKMVRLGPVGKAKTSTASPVASPKTSPSPKP